MAWHSERPAFKTKPASKEVRENFEWLKTQTDGLLASRLSEFSVVTDDNPLPTAIADAGADPTTIVIQDERTLTGDITVPANVDLWIPQGGMLSGAHTITINGPFDAGPYQVFSGEVSVTFGAGTVSWVYIEWWGGKADGTTDCTTAFSKTIASIPGGGKIQLTEGTYNVTQITMIDGLTIEGVNRRSSVIDNTHATNSTVIVTDLNSTTLRNFRLSSTGSTTGYAISGLSPGAETQRYPKISNLMIGGHKGGIILENPLDVDINNCYIGGQGKAVAGGIGIKLDSGTTTSVSSTYVTSFEHGIEVSTAPYTLKNVVFEVMDKGLVSITRGVVIEPYFNSIDTYDIDLSSNGILLVGYVRSAANKINYADVITRRRTTILRDSADIPVQIFGRLIHCGTSAPGAGDFTVGDIYFNTAAGAPLGWMCAVAGTPGTWIELGGVFFDRGKLGQTVGIGEDTLALTTIPASTLSNSGGAFTVTAIGEKSGAGGNKTIKFYVGASSYTVFPAANNANYWKLEVVVGGVGAAAQRGQWTFLDANTVTTGLISSSEDFTANFDVKLTGECAFATDHVKLRNLFVERK